MILCNASLFIPPENICTPFIPPCRINYFLPLPGLWYLVMAVLAN